MGHAETALDVGATPPKKLERSDLWLRWPMLVLICCLLIGDFYCYDNPAALQDLLRQRFSSQMDPDEFQTKYQLLYMVYAAPNVILPFFGGECQLETVARAVVGCE